MAWHLLRPRRPVARRSGYRPFLEMLESRAVPTVLPAGFTQTSVVFGFSSPTNMELSPDGRLFVLTQGGNVKLVHSDGTTYTALHLTVDSTGERGLLGIAFDPQYTSNHFVYLYYTNPNAGGTATGVHNQISRFTVDDTNPLQPVFGNETPILDLNDLSSATNHNGGGMHFGASGMLFVGVGENANPPNSQTLGTLLGKLLRINVHGFVGVRDDTTVGHIIPSDNPFVGIATGINQLIYALGLRNPFTFAVQPGTGKIFINDVGQSTWEEIDQAFAGANYGWPDSEGFKKPTDQNTTIGTYHDPLLAYNHNGGPAGGGSAIVGGAFYNPTTAQFPSNYFGKYFYEDLSAKWIRVFASGHPGSLSNPDTATGFATGDPGATVAMKVDAAGNLYYLSQSAGVERISYVPVAVVLDAGGAAAGSYAADADFQGGTANQVSNTIDTSQVNSPAPQAVYQSWRDGTFTYTLPNLTAGASYNVRLDFSENVATGAGQDVFNVVINGRTVLKNFDVFAAAGGAFRAIERDFATSASTSGTITVAFKSVTGQARVNGISATPILVAAPVLKSATPSSGQVTLTWAPAPGATGYRVQFGTTSYVDASGSPLVVGKVTTATITGLVNGQSYDFWVEALSGSAVSPNSNELTATPSGTAPLPAVPRPLLALRAPPEPGDAIFFVPFAPARSPLSPALVAFAHQSNHAVTTENPNPYVLRMESIRKELPFNTSVNAVWEAIFLFASESVGRW
jgi:glucose/arabinose dehydrogenase